MVPVKAEKVNAAASSIPSGSSLRTIPNRQGATRDPSAHGAGSPTLMDSKSCRSAAQKITGGSLSTQGKAAIRLHAERQSGTSRCRCVRSCRRTPLAYNLLRTVMAQAAGAGTATSATIRPAALKACELYFSQAVSWDKQHSVLTRKGCMGAHEWCFYGWHKGPPISSSAPSKPPTCGPSKRSTRRR